MIGDQEAVEVFSSLTSIIVGDGARTLFWRDNWIRGVALADVAPLVEGVVTLACASKRTVQG